MSSDVVLNLEPVLLFPSAGPERVVPPPRPKARHVLSHWCCPRGIRQCSCVECAGREDRNGRGSLDCQGEEGLAKHAYSWFRLHTTNEEWGMLVNLAVLTPKLALQLLNGFISALTVQWK